MSNFKSRFFIEREHEKIMGPSVMIETDVSSSEGSFDGYNRQVPPNKAYPQGRPQKRIRRNFFLQKELERFESGPQKELELRSFLTFTNKHESYEDTPEIDMDTCFAYHEALGGTKAKKKIPKRERTKTTIFRPDHQDTGRSTHVVHESSLSEKKKIKRERKSTNFYKPDKEDTLSDGRSTHVVRESSVFEKREPKRERKSTNFYKPDKEDTHSDGRSTHIVRESSLSEKRESKREQKSTSFYKSDKEDTHSDGRSTHVVRESSVSEKRESKRERKSTNFFKPDEEDTHSDGRSTHVVRESSLSERRDSIGVASVEPNKKSFGKKRRPQIDNIIASIDRLFVDENCAGINPKDVITRLESDYETTLGNEVIHFVHDHVKNLVLGKVRPICKQYKRKIEELEDADRNFSIYHWKKNIESEGEDSTKGSKKKRKRRKRVDKGIISDIINGFYSDHDKFESTKKLKGRHHLCSDHSNIEQKNKKHITQLKEKKEHKQLLEQKSSVQGCQGRSGKNINLDSRYKWMERLDDTADLAYRAAYAKLKITGPKAAFSFFHQLFREVYAKVDEAMLDLFRNNFKCQGTDLLNLRNKVVGLWCGYVRLLMEIADMVGSQKKRTRNSSPLVFNKISSSQVLELQNALFDFALMVLSQANCCSLAGNHAFIRLFKSKISLFRNQFLPGNGRTAIESFKFGSRVKNSEPHFDQLVIDTLTRFDIVEKSTVLSLFYRVNNRILRGPFLFKDKISDRLLQWASDILLSPEGENRSIYFQKDIENDRISSILSCFPALERDRTLDLEVRHSPGEGPKQATNGLYCFDVDIIRQNETTPISEVASFCAFKLQEATKKKCHSINTKNMNNNCTDVEFYCQWCRLSKVFKSEKDLSSHTRLCSTREKTAPNVEPIFKFGDTRLQSNQRIVSFDPESYPIFSNDNLLDVLAYSVELFETTSVNVASELSYDKILAPHFVGQVGLRCSHCAEKGQTNDCSIYPRSIDEMPTSFWLLSLTHLDNCPNQSEMSREMHQHFRRRFRLGSCVNKNYWKGKLLEAGIVESNKGCGLISRGNY